MNLVTYNLTLDYHEIAAQALFLMKKADTARRIVATLSEGGDPYEIAPASYALFTAHKPNGGVVTLNCDILDNSIVCDITEAITALPGKVDCEIKLYDATGDMLTSPKFGIIVDDVVFNNGDDVEEGGEYPAIVYAVGIDSVEQTTISTEDGGTNVLTVTLTDGSKQTVSLRNGSKGNPGKDGISVEHKWNGTVLEVTSASGTTSADLKGDPGTPGKTPIKGTDYYTAADKAEMVRAVIAALPNVEYTEGGNISIEDGRISVITTDVAEQDNTKPITSAGVYATIGNINALLETI